MCMKGSRVMVTHTSLKRVNVGSNPTCPVNIWIDEMYKAYFLRNQRAKTGKSKYKRYTGLPLRYAGGKTRAVGYIIEHIPDNIETLVSPFIGGASIEIACGNELGIKVYGYDIFDILTNYWQVQLESPESLFEQLNQWSPTKEQYQQIKDRLKDHWNKEQLIEAPIELAAHYWFNHNLSYGPAFLGWLGKINESYEKYARSLDRIRKFRCSLLSVECASFEDSIKNHHSDFPYCDPPYYLDDGKMFGGIYPQRNFPVHHKGFKHKQLRDLLYSHKPGFVLSYNDCDTIRNWYSDFKIVEVAWQYTLGQGETRIGKNRIEQGVNHIKKSHELLIIKK